MFRRNAAQCSSITIVGWISVGGIQDTHDAHSTGKPAKLFTPYSVSLSILTAIQVPISLSYHNILISLNMIVCETKTYSF